MKPDKIIADDCFPLGLKLPLEKALQKDQWPAFDLGPRQRQHLDGFHPAGEAVGDSWQGQHVRRAGEQKPTRTIMIILVDRFLDRQQQVRRALDLVNDGPVQAPDEAGRIGLGGLQDRLIVEREIGSTGFPIFRTSVVCRPGADPRSGPPGYLKELPAPDAPQTARTCHLRIPDNRNYRIRLIESAWAAIWKGRRGKLFPLRPSRSSRPTPSSGETPRNAP